MISSSPSLFQSTTAIGQPLCNAGEGKRLLAFVNDNCALALTPTSVNTLNMRVIISDFHFMIC